MKAKPVPKTAAIPHTSPEATLQANIRASLPDVNTAAALAATLAAGLLAAGRPCTAETLRTLAAQSIDLWQDSRRELLRREMDIIAPPAPPSDTIAISEVLGATDCPLKFHEILRQFIPHGDSNTDREKVFRDFLKATQPSFWESEFVRWKNPVRATPTEIFELAEAFRHWRANIAREGRAKGGKKRWANADATKTAAAAALDSTTKNASPPARLKKSLGGKPRPQKAD